MSSSNFADLTPRKKLQNWKDLFKVIYQFSTANTPFGLEELKDLGFGDKGEYNSWKDINNDDFVKQYYQEVAKRVKSGKTKNGGYVYLSDKALEDGFKLSKVPKTFYNKFDWKTQYKGDLSALFVEDSNGKVSDPFDGNAKSYKAIQWDTLPFSDMSEKQASALNWKLFNLRKGDVSKLDLSKVDWDEVGDSKKNVKAFARSFTKLGKADKRELLSGVSDDKLQDMTDALKAAKLKPAQMLFKKGEYKEVEKNSKIQFKVKGKTYVCLAEDIGWSTANAYAKMNGYEMADINNDGLSNFVNNAHKVYESSKKYARGGWSSKEIVKYASKKENLTKPLVKAFGLKYDKIISNPLKAKNILNDTNGLFVKDTTGPSGNGKKGYQFWCQGIDSAPAAYDVNVRKNIDDFQNINKLTRFPVFEVTLQHREFR